MTPPPVAAPAAHPQTLARPRARVRRDGGLAVRLLGHRWSRIRFLSDIAVLYLAASGAVFAPGVGRSSVPDHLLAAGFPLLVLAILHARRDPDERLYGSLLDTGANVLGVVSLSAMMTIALESILGEPHPVGLALRLWLFSLVYLAGARMVLLSLRRHTVRSHMLSTPTLIVGAGFVGDHLVKRLLGDRRYGLRPVGFLDSDPLVRHEHSAPSFVPILGGPEDLAKAVEKTGARQVILAFSSEPDHVLIETVSECQRLGVEVALVPRLYESINARSTLDHVGGLPVVSLRPTDPRGWQFAVKHALDRTLALVGLMALAPVLLAIAAGVRLSSPGPVLFRQRRVGRDGRVFDVFKFRTMLMNSNNSHEFMLPSGVAPGGVEGVDRRTRIGRWLRGTSLDELPQLLNVLRGEMSLVGPRPERPEYVERFAMEVNRYKDRHRVKSGMTGWAQVNGLRGQTSIADRVEWDNYYIQNWSLGLDLRIIALTIAEVLRFRG